MGLLILYYNILGKGLSSIYLHGRTETVTVVTVHTPRGIVDMNSNQKHPGNWNSALQYLV